LEAKENNRKELVFNL